MPQIGHHSAQSAPGSSPVLRCDLVIPVFNRPDLLRDLLLSLERNTNRSLLGTIWIGDDASDSFTRDQIPSMVDASTLPLKVLRHEQNLGFGGNCNALFAHVTSPYCIILNTDTQVPPFWLERMLAPFLQDSTIALATPFATNGAANHTLRLQEGQSWTEVDRMLAGQKPLFPDDCTAVGFCMAMNVALLRERNLFTFDPAFGRGYGEDTDLHYRVVSAKLRSVIVDNLLIHHAGGSTFSTLSNVKEIREEGKSVLMGKWAETHAVAYAEFTEKKTLDRVIDPEKHVCRFRSPKQKIDVLFVLPNTHTRYGGVWVICRVIDALITAGFRVAAYVKDAENLIADTGPFGFQAFHHRDALLKAADSVGCVVSTSDRTIRTALSLSQDFQCTEVLFLQNMEVAFRSGMSIDTFRQYRRISNVVTVSQALEEYIRMINPQVNVTAVPLGPDPLTFYPRDTARIPKTIAITTNSFPEKGFPRALELGLLLRERGFQLTFFGWDQQMHPIPPDIGTVLTDTSRDALAELFSRTEFLIDQSYFEGLGLIPLEAAFCGCIPILSPKGGPEYLFHNGKNSIHIPGYKDLARRLDSIAALTPRRIAKLRNSALKLRTVVGLPDALSQACDAFAKLSGRSPLPYSDRSSYDLPTDPHQG